MTGNFNIRDSDWNSSYLIHGDILTDIADFFKLRLYVPVQQVMMRYIDNSNDSNLVINLMVLQLDSNEIYKHIILPESQHLSYYALLIVNIFIYEEFI